MPKFTVACYAIAEFQIEANNPEEAYEIATNCPIDLELVKIDTLPSSVIDYGIAWSDAMGSEVYDETGATALSNW